MWPDFHLYDFTPPEHIQTFKQNIFNLTKKSKDVILRCHKYTIAKLPPELETKLHKWFNDYIDMYNATTYYLQPKIILNTKRKKFKTVDYETFKKETKYIDVRETLKPQMEEIRKRNNIHIDIVRSAIEHCCEMYKSAYKNHMRGNIKHFRIRKLKYSKPKKTLTLSRMCFSHSKTKEGLLGYYENIEIKDNKKLKLHYDDIIAECKLQYDYKKKQFYLFVPYIKPKIEIKGRYCNPLGIDIGSRCFATCYSDPDEELSQDEIIIECGKNSNKVMDKYYEKLDNLHKKRNKNKISKSKYNKSRSKYQNKLHNRIVDMHWKLANFLCSYFSEIRVGRISTSNLVNKKKTPAGPEVLGRALAASRRRANRKFMLPIHRRKLNTLNTYQFIQRLEHKGEEFRTKVYRVSEYNTTKQCSRCGSLNHNVGDSKIFECVSPSCSLVIDRDINAAINISRRIPKYKY